MIPSLHRPTKINVDLRAISYNIQQVVSHLSKRPKVWAVVKANAYGHGAVEVSKYIENEVDGFCVSNIDEAIELRQSGLTKSILILGVVLPEEIYLAKKYYLTLTISSIDWLLLARKQGENLKDVVCHIKVDSGMGRIGVRSISEAQELIYSLEETGALVEGIFTHFATADEAENTQFNQQLSCFENIISHLDNCPPVVHASNSATSIWHKETIFNAVRLGIVIYGLNPSGQSLKLPYPIKPALSLTTSLVHIKKIPKGARVGYGGTYCSEQSEYIGTIPIGYADGWTRNMQNFKVLIDGQYCQIVGRVSMDQVTLRLTRYYPLRTPVILIGSSGDESISATDVANQRNTINYEVLCLLSDRIPRYYDK